MYYDYRLNKAARRSFVSEEILLPRVTFVVSSRKNIVACNLLPMTSKLQMETEPVARNNSPGQQYKLNVKTWYGHQTFVAPHSTDKSSTTP